MRTFTDLRPSNERDCDAVEVDLSVAVVRPKKSTTNAAPSAQAAGKIRLPRRIQVFLPGLESQPLPLPQLGHTHVQHL